MDKLIEMMFYLGENTSNKKVKGLVANNYTLRLLIICNITPLRLNNFEKDY